MVLTSQVEDCLIPSRDHKIIFSNVSSGTSFCKTATQSQRIPNPSLAVRTSLSTQTQNSEKIWHREVHTMLDYANNVPQTKFH